MIGAVVFPPFRSENECIFFFFRFVFWLHLPSLESVRCENQHKARTQVIVWFSSSCTPSPRRAFFFPFFSWFFFFFFTDIPASGNPIPRPHAPRAAPRLGQHDTVRAADDGWANKASCELENGVICGLLLSSRSRTESTLESTVKIRERRWRCSVWILLFDF